MKKRPGDMEKKKETTRMFDLRPGHTTAIVSTGTFGRLAWSGKLL